MQNGTFVRVFIASPGDVSQERDEACRAIQSWNAAHSLARSILIEPVRVETHSHAVQGGHPQDLINSQLLDRCDFLVAILWSRLGTPTNTDLSGTVQEIREFSETKGADRVQIYFCDRDIPTASDLDQVQAVRNFKDKIKQEGLYTPYSEVSEFGQLFRHQLDLAMNKLLEGDEFAAASAQATGTQEINFVPEANTILTTAAMAEHTSITLSKRRQGLLLHAGGVLLNIVGNDRSEAKWESGLEQLETYGFVDAVSHERYKFRLTRSGFEFADKLWFVLLLRRLDSLQAGELDYVDFEKVIEDPFFGERLTPTIALERFVALESMEQLDTVPVGGEIGAVRLNDRSRKTIREYTTFEFADPESQQPK